MTWRVRWTTRAAAIFAALAALALGGDAAASPVTRSDAAPSARRRATVELRLRDEARLRAALRAAMESGTIALDVDVLAPDRPERPEAPYRVTVGEEGGAYEIAVVDDEHDRLYTRRVERASAAEDEVALEATAHVVVYALEALGRGETIGTPRERSPPPAIPARAEDLEGRHAEDAPPSAPAPSDAVAPSHERSSAASPRFSFGTRASVTGYASNAPAIFGVGAIAGVRFPLERWSFEIAASFEQHASAEVRSSSLSSRFQMHSARIFVRGELALGHAVALGPAIGVGLERMGVTTRSRTGGGEPTISSSDVVGVASPALGARVTIAPRLRAQADLGLHLPFEQVDYVVTQGTRRLHFLEPWSIRPWAGVGLVAEL